jgi:hypothetical protein
MMMKCGDKTENTLEFTVSERDEQDMYESESHAQVPGKMKILRSMFGQKRDDRIREHPLGYHVWNQSLPIRRGQFPFRVCFPLQL